MRLLLQFDAYYVWIGLSRAAAIAQSKQTGPNGGRTPCGPVLPCTQRAASPCGVCTPRAPAPPPPPLNPGRVCSQFRPQTRAVRVERRPARACVVCWCVLLSVRHRGEVGGKAPPTPRPARRHPLGRRPILHDPKRCPLKCAGRQRVPRPQGKPGREVEEKRATPQLAFAKRRKSPPRTPATIAAPGAHLGLSRR